MQALHKAVNHFKVLLEYSALACAKFPAMRFLFMLILFISFKAFAGDTTKLYDPTANVKKDVAAVVAKGKTEGNL